MMHKATLDKNGKITLPQAIIQKLGLRKGDEVAFIEQKLRREVYFYLTTPMSDLIRNIKPSEEPTAR